MKIRHFQADERENLLAFQKAHHFEPIRLLEKGVNTGHTVYLEHKKEVLGIATLYHNAFHPQFENLQFAVDLHNTRRVTTLYQTLLQALTPPLPRLSLLLRVSESQVLKSFLKHHNFVLAITTACPHIDLESSLIHLSQYRFPTGFHLKNYSQLNPEEAEKLRQFRLNGYVKTHYWSPPLSIESPYWQETEIDGENQNFSWVVFKDDTLVLCSDAHFEGGNLYLGWGWHDDAYATHPELKNLWATVLRSQVKAAQSLQAQLIGEFDSSDVYGQYKSALLPHHLSEDNYCIYQQQISGV